MLPFRSLWILMACAALLVGCASQRSPAPTSTVWTPAPGNPAKPGVPATREPAPGAPSPVTPGGAQPAPAAPASTILKAEYDWLHELFGPTPVRLAQNKDGSITVRVPIQFSFDANGVSPKPALQAVLAKLAESMTRQPQATLLTEVPGGMPRALAVRDTLAAQGVPPGRVGSTAMPAESPEVVLRLVP